jgi:hypothetical protein
MSRGNTYSVPRDANRAPAMMGVNYLNDNEVLPVEIDPITKGIITVSAAGGVATNFAVRVDDFTTPNVTYVGRAVPGTQDNDPYWQIEKVDQTTGTVITWANGNANATNVWGAPGDVALLTYS